MKSAADGNEGPMAQGTVSFVTLTPARHTWIGAIRSPLRRVLWTFFPGLFPSPGSVIHRLMDDHDVPALSVAIAKGGIIVFSQGFGFADLDQREKVTADSLFRIASNSKAITAAAVHVLVERGRLSLSDRVFGEGGILGTSF